MVLTKIGASLGGSADIITVTQGSHGFVSNDRGKAVKMTDASGTPTYALAQANTAANAEAVGLIIQVISATQFIIALSGRITDLASRIPDVVAGTVLFLPTTAGALTDTEPTGSGNISKPMAVVTVRNSEMIMLQHRGQVV